MKESFLLKYHFLGEGPERLSHYRFDLKPHFLNVFWPPKVEFHNKK